MVSSYLDVTPCHKRISTSVLSRNFDMTLRYQRMIVRALVGIFTASLLPAETSAYAFRSACTKSRQLGSLEQQSRGMCMRQPRAPHAYD